MKGTFAMSVKIIAIASLLAVSASVSASQEQQRPYVGTWCDFSASDFIGVLIIDSNDQLRSFEVGRQAGESGQISHGYVSQGATEFHMYLRGRGGEQIDLGYVDYKVGKSILTGKKILRLKPKDGRTERWSECTVKSKA